MHPNPIILYDGVCGLCNRFVQFVLKRDHEDRFRFAALQSKFARDILERHQLNADALDTIYLVLDHRHPGERLLSKGDAVNAVLQELGGFWLIWARLCSYFPNRFAIGATISSHETDTVSSAGMKRVRCPIPRTGINSWIWLRQTILPQRSKIGAATFQYEEPNGR